MAVDTALKRASAVGIAAVAIVSLPFPDASVDDADRLTLAHSYAQDLVSGTASNAINAIAQSATGAVEVTGTASSDINAIGQSATGTLTFTGTASSDINAIGQSLTAAMEVTGTASSDINAVGTEAFGYRLPLEITITGQGAPYDGTWTIDAVQTNRTTDLELIEGQPWYNAVYTNDDLVDAFIDEVGHVGLNAPFGLAFYNWTDRHRYMTSAGTKAAFTDGNDNTTYYYAVVSKAEGTASSSLNAIAQSLTGEIDEEEEAAEEPTGGWAALNAYDSYRQKRRERKRRRLELEEYLASLEPVDREIAELMAEPEPSEEEIALAELETMVEAHAGELEQARAYNQRVARALERAATQRNYSALMAFEREMERAREEEEFLLLAIAILE